jgi:hypothetical protein
MGNITPGERVSRNGNVSAGGAGRVDDCSEEKCGRRDAGATNVIGRNARMSPRKKMVGAKLAVYLGDGYRDEGDDT